MRDRDANRAFSRSGVPSDSGKDNGIGKGKGKKAASSGSLEAQPLTKALRKGEVGTFVPSDSSKAKGIGKGKGMNAASSGSLEGQPLTKVLGKAEVGCFALETERERAMSVIVPIPQRQGRRSELKL